MFDFRQIIIEAKGVSDEDPGKGSCPAETQKVYSSALSPHTNLVLFLLHDRQFYRERCHDESFSIWNANIG
jgi:hypothetical protein